MKFALRPYHVISLGGYIVETDFPYRNLIVVNKTAETIKFEIPVFDESWIQTHRDLGLDVACAMAGLNYSIMMPQIVKVNLHGKLQPWVGVILGLLI